LKNRLKTKSKGLDSNGNKFRQNVYCYYCRISFAKIRQSQTHFFFFVNTQKLGKKAEGEFRAFTAQEDNCLFTELYGVTRLSSSFIPDDSKVYISTIQRMYSILKGTEFSQIDIKNYFYMLTNFV